MYTYITIQMTRAGQPVTVFCCNDTYCEWIAEEGSRLIFMTYTAPEEGQPIEEIEQDPDHIVQLAEPIDSIEELGVIMESFNR